MDTFKQFLAFPLLATVLWLMWVLGAQVGTEGWILAASVLLVLSFCLWLGRSRRKFIVALAWILAVISVTYANIDLREKMQPAATTAETTAATFWQPYDPAQLQKARHEGRAVFVDFTAAWCITCQVNKKAVLDRENVRELFTRHNVLALRADWTNYNPLISSALAELGRNSVPVYAFYSADGSSVKLLPQILTFAIIEDLFTTKEVTHDN